MSQMWTSKCVRWRVNPGFKDEKCDCIIIELLDFYCWKLSKHEMKNVHCTRTKDSFRKRKRRYGTNPKKGKSIMRIQKRIYTSAKVSTISFNQRRESNEIKNSFGNRAIKHNYHNLLEPFGESVASNGINSATTAAPPPHRFRVLSIRPILCGQIGKWRF